MRRDWPKKSNRPVVPLTKIQIDILRILAAHRDPESYVAGSTPLKRNTPRFSGDIDVFHDREERLSRAVDEDTAALMQNGLPCNGSETSR